MKTLEIKDYIANTIGDCKYAYAYVGTDLTNATELMIGIDAFDDFDELKAERGMDEDEIEELKNMSVGESIFNETYWTIVRIK